MKEVFGSETLELMDLTGLKQAAAGGGWHF